MKRSFEMFGEKFVLEKEYEWKVVVEGTSIKVAGGRTMKEAKENAIRKLSSMGGEKEIKETIAFNKKIHKKSKYFKDRRIQRLFERIFGVPLMRFYCTVSRIFGYYTLDIMLFDKWLETPDGISTKDYIRQKYGDVAVKLVEKLM